jgi:MFS family permease
MALVKVMQKRRNADPRKLILAALMCTMMLAAMDTTIVSTAIPQIVSELGGFRLFSWVFSIYLLAQTVTIPLYGKLSDLFGRKPVLMTGMLIFLAGSAASSLAWNMVSLIVFRGVQGLGAGAIVATVTTLAGDLYSVRERAAVQGWLSSVWGMAAIIGPLLGGAFAEYVSWRWIFLINLPIGALALLLIGTYLREEFEPGHPQIDYRGALLMLVTAGTLIFGLLQGGGAQHSGLRHRRRAAGRNGVCGTPRCRTNNAGLVVATARAGGIEPRHGRHGSRVDGPQCLSANISAIGTRSRGDCRGPGIGHHEPGLADGFGIVRASLHAHRISRHRVPWRGIDTDRVGRISADTQPPAGVGGGA